LTEICLERWAIDFIAAMVAKAASKKPAKANRRNLRLAFVLDLKQKAQAQRGNKVDACGAFLTTAAAKVPIHQRAGAPLISTPADPAQWKTLQGEGLWWTSRECHGFPMIGVKASRSRIQSQGADQGMEAHTLFGCLRMARCSTTRSQLSNCWVARWARRMASTANSAWHSCRASRPTSQSFSHF